MYKIVLTPFGMFFRLQKSDSLKAVKDRVKSIMKKYFNKMEKSGDILPNFDLLKGKAANIGETRNWGGKKYKKIKKDKWVRVYDTKTGYTDAIGRKKALNRILKNIDNAKDISEIAKIVFESRHKFLANMEKTDREYIDRILQQAKIKLGKNVDAEAVDPEAINTNRNYGDVQIARDGITQFSKTNYIPNGIKAILRPHQIDGVNLTIDAFEKGEKGFILADGAGSGKTMQALSVAHIQAKKGGKVLIIGKNRTNINDAFKKDSKTLGIKIDIVTGKPEGGFQSGNIYVSTYDNLEDFANEEWDTVIFDEAHQLKNLGLSERAMTGRDLIQKTKQVMHITATPMDTAKHVEYISDAIGYDANNILKNFGFAEKKNGKMSLSSTIIPEEEQLKSIAEFYDNMTAKGIMLRREIPLKNTEFSVETVDMTAEQRKKYNAIQDKLDEIERTGKGKKQRSQLLFAGRRYLEEVKTAKTIELVEKKLKEGRQIVLLASRVNQSEIQGENGEMYLSPGTLKTISKHLKDKGIAVSELFGGLSQSKRDKAVQDFNSGESKVIIATPQTGGTGLNLDDITGDNPRTLIEMTAPFSAGEMVQHAARIDRLTTKSKAEVILMLTDTKVDHWNTDIIASKLKTLGATVGSMGVFSDIEGKAKGKETKRKSKEERLNDLDVEIFSKKIYRIDKEKWFIKEGVALA